jgi:F-type H+-transporting ATPase subunit b
MANFALLAHAANAVAEHAGEHAEPMAFGFITPGMWVALSMTAFLAIVVWKKVPGAIAGGSTPRSPQSASSSMPPRRCAPKPKRLRAEYAKKIAGAEADAAAMVEHARHEAQAIIAKAEADTTAMIARREKMATDKIGGCRARRH